MVENQYWSEGEVSCVLRGGFDFRSWPLELLVRKTCMGEEELIPVVLLEDTLLCD